MPMIENPAGHKIDQESEHTADEMGQQTAEKKEERMRKCSSGKTRGSRSAADTAVHADPVSAARTI